MYLGRHTRNVTIKAELRACLVVRMWRKRGIFWVGVGERKLEKIKHKWGHFLSLRWIYIHFAEAWSDWMHVTNLGFETRSVLRIYAPNHILWVGGAGVCVPMCLPIHCFTVCTASIDTKWMGAHRFPLGVFWVDASRAAGLSSYLICGRKLGKLHCHFLKPLVSQLTLKYCQIQ